MKTLLCIPAFLLCLACQSPNTTTSSQDTTDSVHTDTTHSSKHSIDWIGTYKGTTPCADCPGIDMTVTLNADNTFTYQAIYQERNSTVDDKGTFMWHDNGNIVHIKSDSTDIKFKVGENQLFLLDQDEKVITGVLESHYILRKVI